MEFLLGIGISLHLSFPSSTRADASSQDAHSKMHSTSNEIAGYFSESGGGEMVGLFVLGAFRVAEDVDECVSENLFSRAVSSVFDLGDIVAFVEAVKLNCVFHSVRMLWDPVEGHRYCSHFGWVEDIAR